METETDTQIPAKELDFRANDGVEVSLLWAPGSDRLLVQVVDVNANELFELDVAADEALDAFQHPYAYAAFRGVPYAEPRPLAEPVPATADAVA